MDFNAIVVTFKTSQRAISKIKQNLIYFGIKEKNIMFVDNTNNNRGYGGGVNYGIRKKLSKKSDYFLVCNPDIDNLHGTISEIMPILNENIILGGLFKQKNKIYYGGKLDQLSMAGSLNTHKPSKRIFPVDFVSGSLMLFSKRIIEKVGYFNERYFMYYEDVEYCLRARKAGINSYVTTALSYVHNETSDRFLQKDYYLTRNRLMTLATYGSAKQKLHELFVSPKNINNIFSKKHFYKIRALRDAVHSL